MKCEYCAAEWSIAVTGNRDVRFCPFCGKLLVKQTAVFPDSMEKTLRLIVRDYGISHLRDSAKTVAFFADLAPQLKKEKILLQNFLRCNGNTLMIAALRKPAAEQRNCVDRVVAELMEQLYVSESAARMVCDSFWNAICGTDQKETPVQEEKKEEKPPIITFTPEELFRAGCDCAEENPQKAVRLLTHAGEAGIVDAQLKLAGWYRDGKVAEKNPRMAYYWYQRAAQVGNANAQCNLGWCHANGFGVTKNPGKALYWFSSAANAGHTTGMYNLAKCYENGDGTAADLPGAFQMYERAAKNGHINAQYRLGRCYAEGIGVASDMAMAVYWYRKAAKNNSLPAMYEMGQCHEKGNGVDRDRDLAYYWYRQAADKGHSDAKKALDRLGD